MTMVTASKGKQPRSAVRTRSLATRDSELKFHLCVLVNVLEIKFWGTQICQPQLPTFCSVCVWAVGDSRD